MSNREVKSLLQLFKLNNDAVERQLNRLEARLREEDSAPPLKTICREIAEIRAALEEIQQVLGVYEGFMLRQDAPLAAARTTSDAYARELKIEADFDLSPEDGFYHLEHDAEGAPFRWTGPEHSFGFDLFIDRSQARELELRVLRSLTNDNLRRMRCIVDAQEIPLRSSRPKRGWKLTGIVPPAEGTGRTRVSFLVPEVGCPKETNPNSMDDRRLGVAFLSLIVRPEASSEKALSEKAPSEKARKLWDRISSSD